MKKKYYILKDNTYKYIMIFESEEEAYKAKKKLEQENNKTYYVHEAMLTKDQALDLIFKCL